MSFELINQYASQNTPFVCLISFDKQHVLVYPLNELETENILISFPNFSNTPKKNGKSLKLEISDLDYNNYQINFNNCLKHILNGDSYLLNFTQPVNISCKHNLKEIFHQGESLFKVYYKDTFVCFSPERFVEINNNTITTYPMKGTIDADIEDAENKLLTNIKEAAEHNTIVDLLRNDLGLVASNIQVERYRYLSKIKTSHKNLLQASSKISGTLTYQWHIKLGDILNTILPAGSISGAPKQKTLEIINEVEKYDRGFYTGIIGLYQNQTFDSAVMIRFIEKSNDKLYYKAGGGITALSDCKTEYEELLNKIYVPVI